ncbi:nitrate reductase molybdenum cofactor assembly chaperone [Bacteroides sp. HPS0048]|uniref:nitrate reductase molybdenum cofactor assembly chaperone n=1 Tax=Bacteroides sp. HPS0048 TaxID=1078089 RepID=UPI000382DE47|nr:nitrate reductase molybdenum cofactor assembly chaperone [Bacteroides sp. HPS0048]EOA56162.1 nitrate reductase molybdenum cofactor assembly chaperone [Bacteroides sp. HPS0048]
MQNTYKILSLLLDYPNEELKENLSGVMGIVEEESYLDEPQRVKLQAFIDYVLSLSLTGWQQQYVQLFDFSTHSNLYLFDHVYGDSRERGQAMVDLTEMYAGSGFTPCSNELPDYLPLFLEYLSLLTRVEESEELLHEVSHILDNMKQALEKKETPYVLLLDILHSLSTPLESEPDKKKGVSV